MNKTTIVILAAGLGSRYGGNKQVDGLGPNNEVIMDYSIYDAITAGFDKVVFIIKKGMYESFHEQVGKRVAKKVDIAYAFQELDERIPEWYTTPTERTKPFCTAHALLCAKDVVDTPFCVFNADDYYGDACFKTMHEFLADLDNTNTDVKKYSMIGYELQNTISENGTVTRGVCKTDDNNLLLDVQETFEIKEENGIATGVDGQALGVIVSGEQVDAGTYTANAQLDSAYKQNYTLTNAQISFTIVSVDNGQE